MERIFDWKFRSIFFMRAILWRDDCRLRGAIDFHYHHHQNKAVLWGRRPVDWSQALLRNRWHQCWNVDANSTSQKQHLSGCKQRVVVEGASSDELDVSGVPQGSVLGPCLFLYYINDMAQGTGLDINSAAICGRHDDLYGNHYITLHRNFLTWPK